MIGGNDEAPQPEVDAQSNSRQRQPGESAYRYYRRRIGGWFRQITHEQHLAYGTWALAVGTWGLFLLPGSAGQFFHSRTRRVEVYNLISFGFEPWGLEWEVRQARGPLEDNVREQSIHQISTPAPAVKARCTPSPAIFTATPFMTARSVIDALT